MIISSVDLPTTVKSDHIQENMIEYMRLFANFPQMVMVDDAETFWFVSNKPAPGNIVLRACWFATGIEKQIDELFQCIGSHIDQIDWMVFPGDQPSDLGKRLEMRGMPGGRGGNWLWANLSALDDAPSIPDGFHIERVSDDQMLEEWVRVSEAGFGMELKIFYDAYARHGYGSSSFSSHYIGYLGDTPVTSGTLLDAGGCASIYDVSTPPVFRRQGFAGVLMGALMGEIRSRGYKDTWIWSSDMARSLYQKLGYIDVDFGLRVYSWNKNNDKEAQSYG
jgi:GNAT superfamily N-acetyltransferase